MTPEQISVITATIPVLEQNGKIITETFYRNMMTAHPELNNVFNITNQKTGHQAKVLAGALYSYAANINNLEALDPMLELVCQKHASLHITPDQYDIVGKYLIEAMQEVLGDGFTPTVHDAWSAAYGQLAAVMIQKESSLYDQGNEWRDWRDFRISRVSRESDEVASFYLSPVDGKPLPSFVPGQYVSVRLNIPNLGYMQARQYSMSDAPSPEYYRISVKQERSQTFTPGLLSNVLHDIKGPGQIMKVSHPRGDFCLDIARGSSPTVLLAGGIGITPLLSMFKFLTRETASEVKRPIHLIYATRNASSRAFFDEITEANRKDKQAKVTYFVESPQAIDKAGVDYHHVGRLNLQRLDARQDLFVDNASTGYYICGPTQFLNAVKRSLVQKGVESSNIKMEVFGAGGFVETKPQAHL
ncbi:Globin [Penicillium angulare]|uniref:nitric oxide dioxygenase n=1 Tax=Penicillium angulare TaxID=116970 RepID=A0A9W9KNS3_9EURO|nr:Globin [Penicillium angulare]